MRLPLNLFGFQGADNRAAPLSSAAFAALPSPAQSTLFSDVPQAHVASDAYSPTYPPAEQYANFSSGTIDTDLGSLGLEWNGSLLNESTASPHQTTSYDGAYLSTAGPSSFNKLATYALPDATEPQPAYYPPVYPPATSSIGDVECGFNAYLPESANPSFLSDRSAWLGLAPEEFPQLEEHPEPAKTACPEDCFDVTGLPLTPPAPWYDSSLQTLYNTSPSMASYDFSPSTASYDTSPSTASFDGKLSEQYLPLYSPAAKSVDSCSPIWPSNARSMLPPSRTAYNSSPSAASYDTSPSTASFNGSLSEQYPAQYSPAATSVGSCSPTRASRSKPVLPLARIAYNSSPSTVSCNTSPSTVSYDTSPSRASFNSSFFEPNFGPYPYSPAATSVDSCSPTWPSSAKSVLLPNQSAYNVSPSTASYDTSPSAASFDGSLSEQYRGPYSPAVTSVDSCSPPSSAKPVLPPSGTSLGRPARYAITGASSWPVASSSKRRYEDDDVLEMPRTKRIKELGEYQGFLLPPPVAGSSKRRLEDDEESVEEPLMKKMRKMKNKKRPARSAETQARRVSTEALRPPQLRFAGPSRGDISTVEDRTKFHNRGVEGPEQTTSGSSSQTTQVENATPAPSEPIQAAPAPKEPLRCPITGCTNSTGYKRAAELNRHILWSHVRPELRCPRCAERISRPDALYRHLETEHGCERRAAHREAKPIVDAAVAAVGWRV